jgi:hypothetical protein
MVIIIEYLEENSSWEAESHSASQGIPRLLWNLQLDAPHYPKLAEFRQRLNRFFL